MGSHEDVVHGVVHGEDDANRGYFGSRALISPGRNQPAGIIYGFSNPTPRKEWAALCPGLFGRGYDVIKRGK